MILGITERQAVRDLLPRRPDMVELMTDLYSDVELAPPAPRAAMGVAARPGD